MQQSSRREFVAASFAGVPMLAYAGWAAPEQNGAARAAAPDPVLEQINASVRELMAEGEKDPSARREVTRGIEAALGVQAAHLATHYDPQIKRALQKREARSGRAALVDDLVKTARQHQRPDVTHEQIDATVTTLSRHGLAGIVRDGQRSIRQARVRAAGGLQAAAFSRGQYDYCSDLRWMIDLTTMALSIVCGIAILEPGPGLEIVCGAITLYLGLLLLQQMWWC